MIPIELDGSINVAAAVIREHIAASIRRPLPQARPYPLNPQVVAVVGGGPSLTSTLEELREQVFAGTKIVALNGAARWLVERNIRPSMHVVLDARPSNARFLEPAIPGCKVFLASQCAPETFDAARDRDVTIWHAVSEADEDLLSAWYDGHYHIVGGGTTVALRAIALLRMLGFVRMHLFGIDSCWMGDAHHAYDQPENAKDLAVPVYLVPRQMGGTQLLEDRRLRFLCDPWHMKQAQEFETMIRAMGDAFQLHVHGNGLLASMLTLGASLATSTTTE